MIRLSSMLQRLPPTLSPLGYFSPPKLLSGLREGGRCVSLSRPVVDAYVRRRLATLHQHLDQILRLLHSIPFYQQRSFTQNDLHPLDGGYFVRPAIPPSRNTPSR